MADILMIEDDMDFYRLAAGFLRQQGHRLALAVDPAHLYAVLRDYKPDLVILDLQIPGGGPQLARRALDNHQDAATPVLVCSGMPVRFQKGWLPESPLRRYIAKPVRLARLKILVDELLSTGSRAAGHA